jgi:hypothetical protein
MRCYTLRLVKLRSLFTSGARETGTAEEGGAFFCHPFKYDASPVFQQSAGDNSWPIETAPSVSSTRA